MGKYTTDKRKLSGMKRICCSIAWAEQVVYSGATYPIDKMNHCPICKHYYPVIYFSGPICYDCYMETNKQLWDLPGSSSIIRHF